MSKKENTYDQVLDFIADYLKRKCDADKESPIGNLMDSLDIVMLCIDIEKRFSINLEDDYLKWADLTARELAARIAKKIDEPVAVTPKYTVGDVVVLNDGSIATVGSVWVSSARKVVYRGVKKNNVTSGHVVAEFIDDDIVGPDVEAKALETEKQEYCNMSLAPTQEELLDEALKNVVVVPEGCEAVDEKGNVINTQFIMWRKKASKYPQTYEECLKVLHIYNGLPDVEIWNAKPSECELFEKLIRLRRCRDAYWKLAGDWQPDWSDPDNTYYCIRVRLNEVTKSQAHRENRFLVFPTEEMRDAFYDAFYSDIVDCKEFL